MNENQDQVAAEGSSQSYEQVSPAADPWEQAVAEGTQDISGTMGGKPTHKVNVPGVGVANMHTATPEELAGEAAQPPTDPLDQVVEVPGIGPAKLREVVQWRNQGLMEADYRRKTQALAQLRNQVEEKERSNEDTAKQLFQFLTQLQAQQSQSSPTMPQGFQPEDAEDPYYQRMIQQEQSRINPLYQRLEALEKQNQQYQEYVQQQQHQAAVAQSRADYETKLEALQKEFEFMDPEIVVAWLINDPSQDLRELARQSHARTVQKLSAFQTKAQQPAGPHTRRTVPPRASGSPPLSTEPQAKTWDEAIKGAKEWLISQR